MSGIQLFFFEFIRGTYCFTEFMNANYQAIPNKTKQKRKFDVTENPK